MHKKVRLYFKSIVGERSLEKTPLFDTNNNIYVDIYGNEEDYFSRFLLLENGVVFVGNVFGKTKALDSTNKTPVVVTPYKWEWVE